MAGQQTKLTRGFTLDQERRGLMASSIDRRNDMVRSFERWLEPRTLADATENDVQLFLDSRRTHSGQKIGARTRYTWLSALGCFYTWAIRAGLLSHDPTSRIVRPKLRRTLPRPISDADLAYARSCATGQTFVWLTLAAYTGLRCAEIAGLHRDDILWDIGKVRVVGKGGKERIIRMNPNVVAALETYPMPRTNGPIFLRPNGGPWPPALLSRAGSVFLHSIGVDATMHQLRHWFGTRAYRACKDIRTVQELMGHASPTTTAIYTAFADDDGDAAVLALPDPHLHLVDPQQGEAA